MQAQLRIARLAGKSYQACGGPGRSPLQDHAELTALIRRHLPGMNASLLATPRPVEGTDEVEWYSDLAGQPESLASLPPDRQAQVRSLLADRVSAIRELADRLQHEDPPSMHLAESLRHAVSYPGDQAVYVVGGQPVLAFWGHIDPKAPVRPVAAAGVAVPDNRRSRLLPLTVGTAAVVLAAAALWYWWPAGEAGVPQSSPTGAAETIAKVKPVIDGPTAATRYCPEEKIVAPPTVIVYDNSGSMAYPLNMPDSELEAMNERYHRQKTAHEQQAQVQAGMNQLARMFGGKAGSTGPAPAFPAKTRWVAANYPSKLREYGPQRMDVAIPLVQRLIDEIPPEIPLGLVAFSDCDKISGKFSGADGTGRAGLKRLIAGLSPDGATPIAASLNRAGSMLDGTSEANPGLIILITDGVEHCEGDPCAVARAIKQAKPWLAAHVVKLGPESSSTCVAQAMDGQVFQPRTLDQLAESINAARITAPFELGCRQ